MSLHEPPFRVVIVGGGFTGGAVAYHLARQQFAGEVVVVEPRRLLGGGLAYDTGDPAHRINVPASKMSLVPGDDDHFSRWIARTNAVGDDPEALAPDGHLYPRRAVFGRYVSEELAPFLAQGRVTHLRDRVVRIAPDGTAWALGTATGRVLSADIVVLATTHPPPAVPPVLDDGLGGDPRLVRDVTADGALDAVGTAARVLIVGTGLTMADVVASLDLRGHTGPITAVSRRGLLSRAHASLPVTPFGTFTDRRHSASSLLRSIRVTIDEAAAQGLPWHAVIDAVRGQAQTFWPTLGVSEQRRIVRHLRPFWDVHRFRVAPQIDAVIRRRIAEGVLEVLPARLRSAAIGSQGLEIGFTRRRSDLSETRTFDAVIVTTGPAHGSVIASAPHLASLASAGWITADATGLGLSCSRQGRAVDSSGQPVPSLLVAGPLARGTFGELMGLPQVSEYAAFIAAEVQQARAGQSAAPRLQTAEAR